MVTKKGLGRGLSSLIPKNNTQGSDNNFKVKTNDKEQKINTKSKVQQIVYMPVDKIVPNINQPRVDFGEHEMEELVNSIKVFGIINPVVVTKAKNNKYEIIAGERRFRAAKIAGLKNIPVIIRKVNNQEKLELALIENIQRKDLTPIEEAQSFRQLLDEFDMTHENIADRLSRSRSDISNTLRLLDLPKEIRQALHKGHITKGHAKAILALRTEREQKNLFKKIFINNLNVREAELLTKKKKPGSLVKKQKDYFFIQKERQLQDALDTKVVIQPKSRGGKIVIQYFSLPEFSHIFNKIVDDLEEISKEDV
jgi:ParB family chromosome partitioning protein